MLRALAGNGGVAMVNFYPAFLEDGWRLAWMAQRPERAAAQAALRGGVWGAASAVFGCEPGGSGVLPAAWAGAVSRR